MIIKKMKRKESREMMEEENALFAKIARDPFMQKKKSEKT